MRVFRGVMGPVTPVTVGTPHGELTFGYRAVTVLAEDGSVAAEFTCEDDPGDFDAKAREAGFVRIGLKALPDGSVPLAKPALIKAFPKRDGQQAAPSVGEGVRSAVSNLTRLMWMGVMMVVLLAVLYGCAAALFRH